MISRTPYTEPAKCEKCKEFLNNGEHEICDACNKTNEEIIAALEKIFEEVNDPDLTREIILSELKEMLMKKIDDPKGPMGVSEWLAHGKKYGYDKYFNNKK